MIGEIIMLYDVVTVFGYEIKDQKVFIVCSIPSLDGHHYHVVKLKKTLISYSQLMNVIL